MNFTKIECMSEHCFGKRVIMDGAGGNWGGRINMAKLRCPECGVVIMIVPMSANFQYSITATTDAERKEERIKKLKEESDLELARKIALITK